LETVGDATDAVPQHLHIEVQDITQPVASEFQIAQQLRGVPIGQLVDGLRREHNQICDQQVDAIAEVYSGSLVNDRQRKLPYVLEPRLREFERKTSLVGVFKQSRAQNPMHLNGASQHALTDLVLVHGPSLRVSAVSAVHSYRRRTTSASVERLD